MKRVLVRTLWAGVLALVFVQGVVWYASVHRHVPEQWPRVYVASDCPASEFAMEVAERASVPLATIPVDEGTLSARACRHTVGLLAESSRWWKGTQWLPESLVCTRLVRQGAEWMMAHHHDQWPVFVGSDGRVHLGADVEGLRTVGIDVSEGEYAGMVEGVSGGGVMVAIGVLVVVGVGELGGGPWERLVNYSMQPKHSV